MKIKRSTVFLMYIVISLLVFYIQMFIGSGFNQLFLARSFFCLALILFFVLLCYKDFKLIIKTTKGKVLFAMSVLFTLNSIVLLLFI